MKKSYLKVSAVVAAFALLLPAGAIAKKPEGKGKPPKAQKVKTVKGQKVKTVSVNLKGIVSANDGTNITVSVRKASGQAKACVGESFTFTASKVHVTDNDLDADRDLADVLVGHEVKVQARVPKAPKGTCGVPQDGVVQAKQIHDRTTPEPEEDEVEEEPVVEEPVAPAV